MNIGVKVFEDNMADMLKLDVDFYEITVRPEYTKDGQVVPETNINSFDKIKDKIVGIHGSILSQGVNLMNRARNKQNKKALEISLKAADKFNAQYVVFHPEYFERGRMSDCSFENLFNLMQGYNDPRLYLEFVPVFGYKERHVFPIWHLDGWKKLSEQTDKRILVDTGHIMITARALKLPPIEYATQIIMGLNAEFVHLADNDGGLDGFEDQHLPIGKGNVPNKEILFNIKRIVKYLLIESGKTTQGEVNLVRSYLRNIPVL